MKALAGDRDPFLRPIEMGVHAYVRCTEVGGTFLLATGVFPTTGLTAPDAIELYRSPFAHLTERRAPYAFFAGANGAHRDRSVDEAGGARPHRPPGRTARPSATATCWAPRPVAQAASAAAATGGHDRLWRGTGAFRAELERDQRAGAAASRRRRADLRRRHRRRRAGSRRRSCSCGPRHGIDFVGFDGTADGLSDRPGPVRPVLGLRRASGNLVSAWIARCGQRRPARARRAPPVRASAPAAKVFYKAVGRRAGRRRACWSTGQRRRAAVALHAGGHEAGVRRHPVRQRARAGPSCSTRPRRAPTPAVIVLTAAAGTLGRRPGAAAERTRRRRHGQLHRQLADGGGASRPTW